MAMLVLLIAVITTVVSATTTVRGQSLVLQKKFLERNDHHGNEFCIAFPSIGSRALSLVISTVETVPVEFAVSFNALNTINATVHNSSLTIDVSSNLTVSPNGDQFRNYNGIGIRTLNSTQLISVIAILKEPNDINVFLVLPTIRYSGISRYQYSHFSTSFLKSSYSMFYMTNCDMIEVQLNVQSPTSLSGLVNVSSIYEIHPQTTIQHQPTTLRLLDEYEIFLFKSLDNDISGIRAWSTRPFGFFSTHICTSRSNSSCRDSVTQIPPTYTWGYLFMLIPLRSDLGYTFRVLPRFNESTIATWSCSNGTSLSNRGNETLKLDGLTVNVPLGSTCILEANRPVGVVQYVDDIVWIASVNQYLSYHSFATIDDVDISNHVLLVTVLSQCFNTSDIVVDGKSVESEWTPIYCTNTTTVCGYGISIALDKGTHTVEHLTPSCYINAIVHGWGKGKGYVYPAGFHTNPIGVPIIALVNSHYNVSESISDVVITISRSGDIFSEVSIEINVKGTNLDGTQNIHPLKNSIIIIDDFDVTKGVVIFKKEETISSITLKIKDDSDVELPKTFLLEASSTEKDVIFLRSQAKLTIQDDDDEWVIGFNRISVRASENSRGFSIVLKSNIPVQFGLLVKISTVNGTAGDATDYIKINDDISFQQGELSKTIDVRLQDDNIAELDEAFTIRFNIQNEQDLPISPKVINDTVLVTVTDEDSITVIFSSPTYNFTEEIGNATITLQVSEGGNDFPLDIFVSTNDITAIAYNDYRPIQQLKLTILPRETSKSFDISIIDDNAFENLEAFSIKLNTSTPDQVKIGSNNIAVVSIQNDDNVTVGFDNTEYSTYENENILNVTVELKSGIAFRSFLVHIATSSQQAIEDKDYILIDRDYVFPANTSSLTIPITIINDNITEEPSESFRISLTPSTSKVTVDQSRQSARVTINEDDKIFIKIDSSTSYVGREGDDPIMIKLIKNGITDSPVSVLISSGGGTATEGVDYRLDDSVIDFNPDETVKFYPFKIIVDSVQENEETAILVLSPYSGNLDVDLKQEVTVTILDLTTTVIGFNSSLFETVEGNTAMIALSIVGSVQNASNITINTSSGTASVDEFEHFDKRQIIIPAGRNEFIFSIHTFDDNVLEGAENFTVHIFQSSNNIHPVFINEISSTATVVIQDDDNVTISLKNQDLFVNENVKNIDLTIDKVGQTAIDIPILLLFDGSADEADYEIPIPIVQTLPHNVTSINITVAIKNDDAIETLEEFFTVTIVPVIADGVIVSRSTTTVHIQDDDFVEVYFNSIEYITSEDSELFSVEVSVVWSKPVPPALNFTVQMETSDGTAKSPGDYKLLTRALNIESSKVANVSIDIIPDMIFENTEHFYVNLTNPSSNRVVIIEKNSTTVVKILDVSMNNILLTFDGPAAVYETDAIVTFQFVVTPIFGARERSFNFNFTTLLNGTARAGQDFNATSVSIEFAPGETTKNISVPLIDDNISETREYFSGVVILEGKESEAAIFHGEEVKVHIDDDEAILIGFEQTLYTVDEGSSLVIDITQKGAVNGTVNISISSINIEATGGQDFKKISEILEFTDVVTRHSVTFEAFSDDFFELNESLLIVLSLVPAVQPGVKIINNRATVIINSLNVLVLNGDNVVALENSGKATVCISSSIIPFDMILQANFTVSSLNPATSETDYNSSMLYVPLNRNLQLNCFDITIFGDNETESDEHFCVTLIHSSGKVQVNATSETKYCPLNYITVTIQDLLPICYVENRMVVTPFPKSQAEYPLYNYSSTCEHILTRRCDLGSTFIITADHNVNDLTLERIGIQLNDSFIIISDNLTVTTKNLGQQIGVDNFTSIFAKEHVIITQTKEMIAVSLTSLGLVLKLIERNDSSKVLVINATDYKLDTLCGLCGTINGVLLYSDRETQVTTTNTIDSFAKSWLVNPNEKIIGGNRSDCGGYADDSVVGDPLFNVLLQLTNSTSKTLSLCYELHGVVDKVFNLISDHCISVNALYAAMNNPSDGNIITSIGIKAVDSKGKCVNIVVSLQNGCMPLIDGKEVLRYDSSDVTVTKHMSRVRVSVPNCENEQLVMWMMCDTINNQYMINFVISRGINLSPTSHGLMGQFWNVPLNVEPYHADLSEELKKDYDPDKLYLVSVFPFNHTPRRFIGELFEKSWDNTLKRSCIYVGSSQGDQLIDIAGPHDTVIEGIYTDYIVSDGLSGTRFKYNQFQSSLYCQ